MWNLIKFIYLTFVFYCVNSLDILCNSKLERYRTSYDIQTCVVHQLLIIQYGSKTDVEICYDIKASSNSCKNFIGFILREKITKIFPKLLHDHLPSLRYIYIENCRLEKISQDDLSPFGEKLRELSLKGNKIQKIDLNLFIKNPQICFIDLSGNKILTIDPKAFNGLNLLRGLCLIEDDCISSCEIMSLSYKKIEKYIKKFNTLENLHQVNASVVSIKSQENTTIFTGILSTVASKALKENEEFDLNSNFLNSTSKLEQPPECLVDSSNITSIVIILGIIQILIISIVIAATICCIKIRKNLSDSNEIERNSNHYEMQQSQLQKSSDENTKNCFNNSSYGIENEYAEIVERKVIYDHLNHLQAASRSKAKLKGYDVPKI